MVAPDDSLDALIGGIYDAALQASHWPDALRGVCGELRCAAAVLAVHPWRGGLQWMANSGAAPAFMPKYEQDFSSSERNPYFDMCHRLPMGEPIPAEAISAPARFEDTEFYRAILAPQGLRYSVVMTLLRDDTRVAAAAVLRTLDAGPFGDPELAILRRLAPHLQRALKLTLRIEQLQAEALSLGAAINVSATGTVLADAKGLALFVNPAAARMLKENDGLSLKAGVIAVHDDVARRQFAAAIARASEDRSSAGVTELRSAAALSIPRRSERQPFTLLIWPLRLNPGPLAIDVPTTLILMTDPIDGARPPLEALAAIYGFTPSETAVAALLAEGRTPKDLADRLGITMNTAKTHMKQLFAKTNTNRQAELIRLVLQFPPLASR